MPERAAQPDSHTQQPNAKPLAQLSDKFKSMPNVAFKEQKQVHKYGTDTIHTDKHTKRFSHTKVLPPALCAEDQTVLHTCFLGATTIL
jgi:hypothetical protein